VELKSGTMVIPANGHDICNYLARYGVANCQIQAVLGISGRLDYDRLKRAFRLSVDAEPVFGCQFVEDEQPYWKRRDKIDDLEFCAFEEAENPEDAIRKFIERPLDMDNDPMVKAKLIRSWTDDILCIKVNHACCDGTGVKEYIRTLADIYSAMRNDGSCYIPESRIAGRKDQDRMFDNLGVDPESAWNPFQDAPWVPWPFPWKSYGDNDITYTISRFTEREFRNIKKFAKKNGAAINDLLLTAYYRSMFELCKVPCGIPMDISSTIDLRRYLPGSRTNAIRNFSGGFTTRIPREQDESFKGTLYRIIYTVKAIMEKIPGLQNALGAERVEKMNFILLREYMKTLGELNETANRRLVFGGGLCYPGLSNLGLISDSIIRFGKTAVTDAYIIGPAVRMPGFLLLAGTYNNRMSLGAAYYLNSVSSEDVEKLLDKIRKELIENCL